MLLLDTHVLIWWLEDPSKLATDAAQAILAAQSHVWISVATLWEMEIKRATGRLNTPDDVLEALEDEDFSVLAVTAAHALGLRKLRPIHGDPFDRMLLSQAMIEGMTIVTRDEQVCRYGVPFIRA